MTFPPARLRERDIQPIDEQHAVRQKSQRVVVGLIFEPLCGDALLRDVEHGSLDPDLRCLID